jgi:hypothetical protein
MYDVDSLGAVVELPESFELEALPVAAVDQFIAYCAGRGYDA